jgi:hypothetical protein
LQNGPIVVRASISTGWEYSDELPISDPSRKTVKSSLFTAPAIAVLYDRDMGAWNASARYSAGYLHYFDRDFVAAGDSGGGFSQTAGLDLTRKGTRLLLRSSATGSYGTGYELDRGQETKRLLLGEVLSADYQLAEFIRIGATGTAQYNQYADEGGADSSDDTHTLFSGTVFGDYFWTGKTGFHFEAGSGRESQGAGAVPGTERSYIQALLGINYQPTAKLSFRAGIGLGTLNESGVTTATAEDGTRTVYSLDASYTPTEKLSALLHFGLLGSSVEPDFSLVLNWHPREPTSVHLSVYQQTGLSTISFAEDQTRRGVLASLRQRLFQRIETNLSAGWEEQELRNASTDQSSQSGQGYPYYSATVAWELNKWMAWQVQYIRSSRREGSVQEGDRPNNRASTSLRLTF